MREKKKERKETKSNCWYSEKWWKVLARVVQLLWFLNFWLLMVGPCSCVVKICGLPFIYTVKIRMFVALYAENT